MESEQESEFQRFYEQESKANAFSKFYRDAPALNGKFKRKLDTNIQRELNKYTHNEAIAFAAKTWTLDSDRGEGLEYAKVIRRVPTFKSEEGSRAFYRVLAERQASYVLIACHANLHGFHRGDLRFVEVNERTITRGLENRCVVGMLYPGDIIAVTELCKKSTMPLRPRDVFHVTPDDECVWAVAKMTVLSRKSEQDVNFSVLENGLAVAEGYSEPMNVKRDVTLLMDIMYKGTAFFPDKLQVNFTEDFDQKYQNPLTALFATMPTYSNSYATIISYEPDSKQTKMLEIGLYIFNPKTSFENNDEDFKTEVVQKCVLMGASAANTVSSLKYDRRSLQMQDIHQEDRLVHFSIVNPNTQPTEGRWSNNHRVLMIGLNLKIDATIETAVLEEDRRSVRICVRIPRNGPRNIDFQSYPWIVQQQQSPDAPKIEKQFFKKLDKNSNGRRIIETLYGGPKIEANAPCDPDAKFFFPSSPQIALNECQNDYVSMILDDNPIVLGTSPFGCGKTMTIITAAFEVFKKYEQYSLYREQQLVVTQSNNAGVSIIEMMLKMNLRNVPIKLMRYISETNWNVIPDAARTELDMPKLMRDVFFMWATIGKQNVSEFDLLTTGMKCGIVRKVTNTYHLPQELLVGEARRIYLAMDESHRQIEPSPRLLREAFFILYRPDIIVATADSLQGILACSGIQLRVSHLQIDEASQLPEHALIYLLQKFPHAAFGLVGDIKQLPPHCEVELKGRLKEYGIGNTMERAIREEMFPQSTLRYVYRCHPITTRLLSSLFYNGLLISGVQENDRNEFMRMRSDIWPNVNFPILVLNHREPGRRVGTSVANDAEKNHVIRIVQCLTREVNGYKLEESDIGVISFYRAQTSLLTEAFRKSRVKCGTIDAFQGTEREVMIVCCTNEKVSDFMTLGNRLNVAMSRARQATILIGNVDGLLGVDNWNTIVQMALHNSCFYDNIFNYANVDVSSYLGHPVMVSGPLPQLNMNVQGYDENWQLIELRSQMQQMRLQYHQMSRHENRLVSEMNRSRESELLNQWGSFAGQQPKRRNRPSKAVRDRQRMEKEY